MGRDHAGPTDSGRLRSLPRAVRWEGRQLILLDQRKLPLEECSLVCESVQDVHEAICTLTVRGAPAIGIAAAYGLLIGLSGEDMSVEAMRKEVFDRADYLVGARPTAVNLSWAIQRVVALLDHEYADASLMLAALEREAVSIHEEDISACRRIGIHGAPLVKANPNVLTHCNAGSLAVSEMGTALAPVYTAYSEGVDVHVFVDETRPLLQGARLTAYELQAVGVRCTLITDNMAAWAMSSGKVDMVIVGTDRVTVNGDVANKIGTLNLAILCQYYEIPFYVACPVSTIDLDTVAGSDIRIEQRHGEEVTRIAGHQIAPDGISVLNPAFDVTPASLVTGIITENGIASPPCDRNIRAVVQGG